MMAAPLQPGIAVLSTLVHNSLLSCNEDKWGDFRLHVF